MINGMTILEQTPIKEPTNFVFIGSGIGILMLIIAFVYVCVMSYKHNHGYNIDGEKVYITSYRLAIIGFIIAFTCIILPFSRKESGRYTYKCTFEDYVTVNDITEVYEITDVIGNIWIVEDKNIEVK